MLALFFWFYASFHSSRQLQFIFIWAKGTYFRVNKKTEEISRGWQTTGIVSVCLSARVCAGVCVCEEGSLLFWKVLCLRVSWKAHMAIRPRCHPSRSAQCSGGWAAAIHGALSLPFNDNTILDRSLDSRISLKIHNHVNIFMFQEETHVKKKGGGRGPSTEPPCFKFILKTNLPFPFLCVPNFLVPFSMLNLCCHVDPWWWLSQQKHKGSS